MKFSNDAMRDVLMFIQDNIHYDENSQDSTAKKSYTFYLLTEDNYFSERFDKHGYTKDELKYTVEKLMEINMIKYSGDLATIHQIYDISFEGVQILKSVQSESIWEETKSVMNKCGNYSLRFLEETALMIAKNKRDYDNNLKE